MATYGNRGAARRRPDQRRSGRPAAAALILLWLLALGAGPAGAQPAGGTPGDPPAAGLEPQPLVIESLGLQMHPPAAATVQVQRTEQGMTVSLIDGAAPPAWSMRIQSMVSILPEPTAEQEIDRLLQSWTDKRIQYTVLSNEPVRHGERDGRLCYVRQEATGGQEVVAGWLVIATGDREFLVFAMQMLPEHLPRVRILLDDSFSTIRVRGVEEIVGERKARLEVGQAFLRSLTPDTLATLVGPGRWYRYYLPAGAADAADVELGCMYVEFTEARRGAVKPDRPIEHYDTDDHEMGLMAGIRGQLLDPSSQRVIDSIALYWMAWDQSQERWSVTVTTRQGRRSQSAAQTGIRRAQSTSEPAGAITVIDSATSGGTRDEANWATPDVYLSQPLRWALGRLLPRDTTEPVLFNWYCFDGASTSLSLRVDEWGPAEDESGHRILTSRPRSDAPPITTVYDADGEILRRTWPDGSVNEPISLQSLRQLWQAKGLGTEILNR